MKKLTTDDPTTHSADVVAENVEHLRSLFPEAFTEGKVDFEVLKQLLGGLVDEREEKYGLNWHGKRRARQLALTPSTGTLRPCPEESVDWDTTQNLMIEGDNLEVLKLLQKSYSGKVKLIYIDPPYNTGKDFVYPDNFRDNIRNYLELTGQADGENGKLSSNSEASGRFHTDWLNMMYPRLRLARNLLLSDGLIFITIGNDELNRLWAICDDIFGEENLVSCFVWEKRTNRENRKLISSRHDYVLCYAKNAADSEEVISMLPMDARALSRYKNPDEDPRGPWKSDPATAQEGHATPVQFYTLTAPNGQQHELPGGRCWVYTKDVMNEAIRDGRIWFGREGNGVPRIKTYLNAKDRGLTPESLWFADQVGTNEAAKNDLKKLFGGDAVFDTPKPVRLVERMIQIAAHDGIILDFFAGSGVTAHAVFNQNRGDGGHRRFILVQLPEATEREDYATIADITKARLRGAGDSFKAEDSMFSGDLGFRVFKLDRSNIRAWDPNPEDLEAALFGGVEHLHEGRTEQDVLYELLLKLGLDLCVPIEERTIADKPVHSIGAGTLLVCLAKKIAAAEVETLALGMAAWREEQNPAGDTTVVFRDAAFADDVAKTNMAAILEQHGLATVRSL
ncbi:MAG: site-specific DNA-methyltransferase [Planctomycetota bacterium]